MTNLSSESKQEELCLEIGEISQAERTRIVLNRLLDTYVATREAYETQAAYKKDAENLRDQAEMALIAALEELELTKFEGDAGNFYYYYREGFAVPKTDEDKKALFSWLQSKGLYDTYVTVNSQAINSLAKAEMEIAEEAGQLDFQIPGLKKSEPFPVGSLRRK